MYDSALIFASLAVFMAVYVLLGFSFFRANLQGLTVFPTMTATFQNLMILLTTCNFPDVMLPSYGQHRHYAVFFVVYLVVGLFMFMNLLLAIFYSNY